MSRRIRGITIPIKYMTNTKGLKQAQSAFGKFGAAVAAISVAAVAAVAKIGSAAVRMASEFEDSFAKIEGLVGVAQSDIGELQEAAARLGPQFGRSANEAAEALFFITSAGLRGKDAVEVLEASLKGAAVGLGDTKTIADLATSAVNAYGVEVLGGAQAVDVLTEAVREGKLEPGELAGSMGQVLPIASNLGVSFQEVGAAFAAMSRTGTDASQASTQLRGILNALVKPTAEAERTLGGMGLSAEGLREQIREEGLLATLETLTDAFDGNIEATASVFGNVRALTGVLDLMGANVEDTRQIFDNMTDDVGALDDAFGVVEETASFKFRRAMETARASLLPVGNMLLEIGSRLLDRLMPVIEKLGPMFEEMFAHLEEPLNQVVDVLPQLLDALLPVLPILGEIAGIIADLVVALLPVFTALLDAIIPVVEAILPPLANFIRELVQRLAPILVTLIELFTPILERILPPFMKIFEALTPIVMTFIDAFWPIIDALLPLLTLTLETIVLPLLEVFAEMMSVWLPAAFEVFNRMGLGANVERMEGWAKSLSEIIFAVRSFMATGMNSMIQALETGTNAAIRMVNRLIRAGKRLPGAAGAVFRGIRELSEVSFERIAMPTREKVDLSGVNLVHTGTLAGVLAASQGKNVPTFRDFSGVSGTGTGTLAGVQAASGGRYFTIGGAEYFRAFADGGVVRRATMGLVGEAGPEAIIPLDRWDGLNGGGSTYNITVNAGMGTDGSRVGEEIIRAIKQYERRSGPVFAGV